MSIAESKICHGAALSCLKILSIPDLDMCWLKIVIGLFDFEDSESQSEQCDESNNSQS
jgi:hypothetical protein